MPVSLCNNKKFYIQKAMYLLHCLQALVRSELNLDPDSLVWPLGAGVSTACCWQCHQEPISQPVDGLGCAAAGPSLTALFAFF